MKKHNNKQYRRLLHAISSTVVVLTLFLIYCLCGSVEINNNLDFVSVILKLLALFLVGLSALVCCSSKLMEHDENE